MKQQKPSQSLAHSDLPDVEMRPARGMTSFIDSATIAAVESLFQKDVRDPWANKLMGQLADLFIYSENISYPIPIYKNSTRYDLVQQPTLLRDLAARDSNLFEGREYSLTKRIPTDEHLENCFQQFSAWATFNRRLLSGFVALHRSHWVDERTMAATGGQLTFDLAALSRTFKLAELATKTGINSNDLLYAFNAVLKFPIYGELAGQQTFYLHHPLRDAFPLPTMRDETGSLPNIPVTFSSTFSNLASHMSSDEYTSYLHEVRGAIRNHRLHELTARQAGDVDEIREIAAQVRLPPRLSHLGKVAAVSGGVISGLGTIAGPGSVLGLFGAALSISTALWSGTLPKSVARIRWLRWALKWDIEDQTKR